MKPFNLDLAIAGDPLVTRDGREVTGFHYFSQTTANQPVLASIGGEIWSFTKSGKYWLYGDESGKDLFMAVKKKTVYLNLYPASPQVKRCGDFTMWDKEEDARKAGADMVSVAIAVPIEIEI